MYQDNSHKNNLVRTYMERMTGRVTNTKSERERENAENLTRGRQRGEHVIERMPEEKKSKSIEQDKERNI